MLAADVQDAVFLVEIFLNESFDNAFFCVFFIYFFIYIQQIKVTTHNKFKIKILTHGQIRTLNQTINIFIKILQS